MITLDATALGYEWISHTDDFRDGGRVASHSGPCGHDAAHLILWHWCADAGRWVPSVDPALSVTVGVEAGVLSVSAVRWTRCCGLAGRVVDGMWVASTV